MVGKLDWLFDIFELRPRDHARITRDILRERGEYHGKHRMPRHFNRNQWTSPGGPYRYRKRSKRNTDRKRKKGVDPSRPNYFTGQMYALVMANGKVTATQYQWRYRTKGTQARPLPEWQRQELEAFAPDERKEDIEWIKKRYITEASRPELKRRRKKRIKS